MLLWKRSYVQSGNGRDIESMNTAELRKALLEAGNEIADLQKEAKRLLSETQRLESDLARISGPVAELVR